MLHYWDLFLMGLSRARFTRILGILFSKYDAPPAHRSVTSLVTLLQAGSLRSQFYIISPKYDIQPAVQVSNSSGYSDATGLLSSIHRPCDKPYLPLWHALFAPVAILIYPCGKPCLPLWQTLFTPVANLIYPCGKPRLPLWQTLFTPVAKPFFLLFIGIFQVT